MTTKRYHMKLSIRGALMNWKDRDFVGVFSHDDGRPMSPREAKAELLTELSKGRVVLPVGAACEGFDYKGAGCPGHEVEDAEATH